MQRDWNLLATSSHYNTAVAVHEELRVGHIDNAITGLEELIEALSPSDECAMESYLTRLMQHIFGVMIEHGAVDLTPKNWKILRDQPRSADPTRRASLDPSRVCAQGPAG